MDDPTQIAAAVLVIAGGSFQAGRVFERLRSALVGLARLDEARDETTAHYGRDWLYRLGRRDLVAKDRYTQQRG